MANVPYQVLNPGLAVLNIGEGVNCLNGEAQLQPAITDPSGQAVRVTQLRTGLRAEETYESADSRLSLANSLNIQASAGISLGAFSLDASYSEQSSQIVFNYSRYICGYVRVFFDPSIIATPTLTPDAIATYKNAGLAGFFLKHGTHFVSGYIKGAELYGIYTLNFSSQEDYDAASLTINASMGFLNDSTVSTQSKYQKIQSIASSTLKVLQTAALPIPSADQFPDALRNFPAVVSEESAFTYGVVLTPYADCLEPPGVAGEISFEYSSAIETQLAELSTFIDEACDRRNEMQFARSNGGQFTDFTDADGTQRYQQAVGAIESLQEIGDEIGRTLTVVPIPQPALP